MLTQFPLLVPATKRKNSNLNPLSVSFHGNLLEKVKILLALKGNYFNGTYIKIGQGQTDREQCPKPKPREKRRGPLKWEGNSLLEPWDTMASKAEELEAK